MLVSEGFGGRVWGGAVSVACHVRRFRCFVREIVKRRVLFFWGNSVD